MSLDVFHGNIAGRARVRRIKRRMRKHKDDALILTEAYNARSALREWCEEYGYQLRHPSRARFGTEGPDVAMVVRNDVEITSRDVDPMTEEWFGPFNYPRSRKEPRVIQTLGLRKAGVDYDLAGVHFPSGGPSGGTATRGKNADAWRECAQHVNAFLESTDRGAAIGDFNGNGGAVRRYVATEETRVAMASNVDGAAAKNVRLVVRRLRSPRHMHGWMTVRLDPITR